LMNPFSKAKLQLPNLITIWHHKMSLTPDSLVAALITDWFFHGTICICQPPIYTYTVSNKDIKQIVDVAFFDGKLYVLNLSEHLFVLEIGKGHKGKPKMSAIRCIIDSIEAPRTACYQTYDDRCAYVFCNYLVESAGKLLYADLTANSCRKWRSVSTLGGQALFVGRCSKSFPAAEYPTVNPLLDSGVFNMRNGTITPLLPETVVVQTQVVKPGCRTWFFPSEAM
ncbi:hypothetical protein BAE44_0015016, partial [Dichanthelium oligosanthes]